MTHADAMIVIAMAAAAIIFGVRATKFYAIGPGQRPKTGTKTIPRWFGRLWCIGFGAVMFACCLPALRGTWHWHDLWDDWWLLPFLGVVCALNLMLSESELEGQIQSLHLGRDGNDDKGPAKP